MRSLPIWLFAMMLAIGIAIELAVYGELLWLVKLPIFGLLAFYAWRLRRSRVP